MMRRSYRPDFGSVGWAIRAGQESARTIRSIRSGGYKTARSYFDYYSDGRWAHGAARRALSSVAKLGNPKPYFIGDAGDGRRMIYALNAQDSLRKGRAIYWAMRHIGTAGRGSS
tara:strand:- start:1098 stop:1439 length:342 start_codon:yes stop_codon:yes gene_type:complete